MLAGIVRSRARVPASGEKQVATAVSGRNRVPDSTQLSTLVVGAAPFLPDGENCRGLTELNQPGEASARSR
jgi:hypothetical protein